MVKREEFVNFLAINNTAITHIIFVVFYSITYLPTVVEYSVLFNL